jgi:hypothetical protein
MGPASGTIERMDNPPVFGHEGQTGGRAIGGRDIHHPSKVK